MFAGGSFLTHSPHARQVRTPGTDAAHLILPHDKTPAPMHPGKGGRPLGC